MKIFNVMKPIDGFITKQILRLKETNEYQKLVDNFSGLEDSQQSIVKALMVFALFFVPLVIILIFSSINSSLKEELTLKENIIKSSKTIIALTQDLKKEESKALSGHVNGESNFKSEVTRTLSRAGIDTSKLEVSSFSMNDQEGDISEIQADIVFKGFSSENIYDFFDKILIQKKVRVDEIEIKKDMTSNLLDGMATIYYYSKLPAEDEI